MATNDTARAPRSAEKQLSGELLPARARRTGRAFSLEPARFGAGMLGVLLTVTACLDVLGDVKVGPTASSVVLPNEAGADRGACGDAGLASGECVIACTPGEGRCSGSLLQRCNGNGDGWESQALCVSPELCDSDALACSPPACDALEHQCTEQGELLICRTDRTGFEHKDQCQSGAYCSSVRGREGCEGVACRAGRQRCNGAQIEQCRADRSGFDAIGEPCASAAACIEGDADLARCDLPSCSAGQFLCEGARLMRCSDDASGSVEVSTCASEQLCNAAEQRCEPLPCSAGQQRCVSNVLERCNATQTGFTPVQTCDSELACDPASPACLTPPPPPLVDTPYTFVSLSGSSTPSLGPLTLTLPAEWTDTDRRPWANGKGETLGPRLIASTDAARFATSFDIPGVLFEATATAPVNVAARQSELDLSARCARGASVEYDDGLYVGTSQTWTNCGSTGATTNVVVAMPESGAFVTVVVITMLGERDQEARRKIWDTFLVQRP